MRTSVLAIGTILATMSLLGGVGCDDSEPAGDGPSLTADANTSEPDPDAAPLCTGGDEECTPGMCTDVATDALNCGSCGNACGLGFTCGGGACLCDQDDCGTVCTDTQVDNQHCGTCGEACGPGGPLCNAGTCECPPAFIPATIDPDMSFVLPGATIGFPAGSFLAAALFTDQASGDSHAILALYDPSETVEGVQLPVDDSVPSLLSAFRFSLALPNIGASAAYTASGGTLTITEACDTRVVISLTDATFSEIAGLMDPTPAENGCQESVPSLNVAIGTTDTCPEPPPKS